MHLYLSTLFLTVIKILTFFKYVIYIEHMNKEIRKVYKSLLSRIAEGQVPPGAMLPKEVELAEEFMTTRMNVHRAMKELGKKQLVVSKKRVGTRVNPQLDQEKLRILLNETLRRVQVLYSTTPHWIHWNEVSFRGLEDVVEPEGYLISYQHIPTESGRAEYQSLLRKIADAGTSALVIFPDMEDSAFLAANADLLLHLGVPVFMLNRSGKPMAISMTSFVSVDPLGDGIFVGELLRRNNCNNVVMLNGANEDTFWGKQRYNGLILGFAGHDDDLKNMPRNILGTSAGIAEIADIIEHSANKVVVVGVNNEYAARLIDYCATKGLHLPQDYQLIAFDDNPLFRSYNLTSLAVPMERIGRLFGKLICDRSWLEEYRGKISIGVNSELVVRETFKPRAR